MAHFIFGFLHELDDLESLSGDDAETYAKWLAKLTRRRFDAKLDIWQPLMVLSQQGKILSFPPADDIDTGFLNALNQMTNFPVESWAAALSVATVIVAEEMHLYGAAGALGDPNEASKRLRSTPSDIVIRDILHEVPARIAAKYQACVDRPCGGQPTGEDDSFRTHVAALYECFLRSYVPPFTNNLMHWYQFYPCLDLREAAFRHKCQQGDESSPYGEVVITFAHVNQ